MSLTPERLREVLTYNPETGVWTWNKTAKWNKEGQVAGCINAGGYRAIVIDQKLYYGHRLAWFWMKGEWPQDHIDHEDTDRSNNRWINLRAATYSTNLANRGSPKNNTSGFKGVSFCKMTGRWRANICVEGRQISLARTDTREQAAQIYQAAALKYFGEFARF